MKKKIDYAHRIDEIASYNGITLNLETGLKFGKGGACYTVQTAEDLICFGADTRRGWASMHSAYEKAALFFNSLVPFEASVVPF